MKIRSSAYYYDEDEEIIQRKRKRKHTFLKILMIITIIITVLALFILVFHTRKINVSGNEYCTEDEVKDWILQDRLSHNTVYTWWKYNYTDAKQLPIVETMEIKIQTPWEISARVYEKSIVGYLDFGGTHVYFDKDGVVLSQTTDTIEGVPLIEGITLDQSKIVVHESLPTEQSTAFDHIFEVSQAMETNALKADRMSISESGDVTLYTGNVTITLGNSDYADKVAQIPPILAKLQENYPGQAGTLHLESYSKTHSSINFTPE